MKLFIVVAALILEMVAAAQQSVGTQARPVSDLQAIEELEHTDAMAAKTNDVDRLTSLWTEDGVLLQPMAPPVIRSSTVDTLPVRQSHAIAAEPLSALGSRKHALCISKQLSAGSVKIVGMMVVAQEHIVKRADIVRTDSRAGKFVQRDRSRALLASSRIERRIS